MSEALVILHRDDHLVAIDKPAGLLVHRSDLDRAERRFAVQLLRDQLGQPVHPVHRLDRGTSGVLLFALDAATARDLGRQFESGEVAKRYLAVVRGWPDESGTIDHAMVPDPDERAGIGSREAQAAVTRYRRLATVELPYSVDRHPTSRYALVELEPLTGRRHQLRRHMKHIAHPIVGDATHGKGVHNRFFRDVLGCDRLLLSCVGLTVRHPGSGCALELTAGPGVAFEALLARFGWTDQARRSIQRAWPRARSTHAGQAPQPWPQECSAPRSPR